MAQSRRRTAAAPPDSPQRKPSHPANDASATSTSSGPSLVLPFVLGVVVTVSVVAVVSHNPWINRTGEGASLKRVRREDATAKKLPECVDKEPNCAYWASSGECEKNKGYMVLNCPKACEFCDSAELLDPDNRCKRGADVQPEIPEVGGLSAIFERLTTDPEFVERYSPTVHSRDPWVVTLENVVSPDEASQLLDAVGDGFERSSSAGQKKADGALERNINDYRTSHNAWCMGLCNDTEVNKVLQQRIADLTMTRIQAQESFQVLRYEVGQYYKVHHDYIYDHKTMPCGPRILTAFQYLNDVGAGGGTHFTQLNITVYPKAGRMLLWPSVKDSNHLLIDQRTDHEAMPVEKGTKFAANAWIHLYDFRTPNAMGCTG
eukprot:m.57645 g.57645  ORF g.57645 m.57645 type:complete len:376 (-) comp7779_c0_seq1:2444-3571(-)